MPLTPTYLRDYLSWAVELWITPGDAPSAVFVPDNRDLALAGLGLTGEAGEALDALDECKHATQASEKLIKELGDVVYYLAVLARFHSFDLACPLGPKGCFWGDNRDPYRQRTAQELLRHTTRVAEVLKKFIRLDTQQVALSEQLQPHVQAAFDRWYHLCCHCGVSPYAVLRANQDKVNSRKERGTLRGSGDYR